MNNFFSIQEAFNASVKKTDNAAIVIDDQEYSYETFAGYVQTMLYSIRQNAAAINNDIIAVAADHSIWMHATIAAVFISGKTLLPFNPDFPYDRNLDILEQSPPAMLLSAKPHDQMHALITALPGTVYIVCEHLEIKRYEENGVTYNISPDAIAYILYTSGSTGKPKGVPVKYKALYHFLHYFTGGAGGYHFNKNDRFLQAFESTFDVFYFSFLVPLCCGAGYYTLPQQNKLPKFLNILQSLQKYRITTVSMVSALLQFAERYLPEIVLPHVKYSFLTGDILYHSTAAIWQKTVPNSVIHNMYGPTEGTIFCSRYIWEETIAAQESINNIVSIGKPFPGISFHIIDEENRILTQENKGELVFNGIQFIDQYTGNVSPENFLIIKEDGIEKNYYKTGDIAAVNKAGNLIFYGRKDSQVKINGYRIEMAEIELAITSIIKAHCVVLPVKNRQQFNVLHAIIEEKTGTDNKTLMELLSAKIPAYMLPAKIIRIDAFPLNENNKINRKALLLNIQEQYQY